MSLNWDFVSLVSFLTFLVASVAVIDDSTDDSLTFLFSLLESDCCNNRVSLAGGEESLVQQKELSGAIGTYPGSCYTHH